MSNGIEAIAQNISTHNQKSLGFDRFTAEFNQTSKEVTPMFL
jgi:hypothetical protein